MSKHVVVGSGPVGTATARELVATVAGADVVLVSRSGRGPEIDGVRRVALDVSDAEALTALVAADGGAEAVYNCVNPASYAAWPTWWPPVAAAFLVAAERTGATLVTAANLYPYGEVDGPMVEGMPDSSTGVKGRLRARMWDDARVAHEAGRLRAVEVRGSDYLGPEVLTAHVPVVARRALAGKAVRVFGRSDVPHTFTDVRDMARTLVTVAARPEAHGRVWHAPSNPAVTQAQAVADVCRAAGREPVAVRTWPRAMLSVGGVFVPFLREMRETVHQFERPYVMDSTLAERQLGLAPTPWSEVCAATARTALGGSQSTSSPKQGVDSTP